MGRIWAQITRALRSRTGEMAKAAGASRALLILEGQTRDADESLSDARSGLAGLVANSMRAVRDLARIDQQLGTLTHDARLALAAGREDLARKMAEQISRLEWERDQGARLVNEYEDSVQALRSVLRNNEEKLRNLKVQIEIIGTSLQASHAQAALSASRRDAMNQLRSAAETLDDIRQHQREAAALMQAREEILAGDAGLKQRLRDAGISLTPSNAESVPERIKANTSRSA